MMEATRCLREEHRLIERVLDGFEIALLQSTSLGDVEHAEFESFLEFFREFADGCHHGKEEERLFALLEKKGLLVEGGPIAQVVHEHEENRGLVSAIATSLDGAKNGDPKALESLALYGRTYLAALRRHIDKEEHCLFGMAEQAIRGDDLAHLLDAYRELAVDVGYAETYERCLDTANRLIARYGLSEVPRPGLRAGDRPVEDRLPEDGRGGVPGASAWSDYAALLVPDAGSELACRVERALTSRPVAVQRAALERAGRRIVAEPMLWKVLPGSHLRLFFPVHGASDRIEAGDVVALVLLYDIAHERTLYAHPVYAGPGANPLLKHVGGPMAQPKAQEGENGDLATRRLLEHKNALWSCFLGERQAMGPEEAGRRWRERYRWALIRLYFCERCSACRWGSPGFDGLGGATYLHSASDAAPEPVRISGWETLDAAIRRSEEWDVEVQYAKRGGFTIGEQPNLLVRLDPEHCLAVYPSDAKFLEGGTIVGAAVHVHEPTGEVRYVHCLSAGPEPEMLLLHGNRALGLPQPGGSHAGAGDAYAKWRAEAWSQFWLDELELGVHAASRRWLSSFWQALARLATHAPDAADSQDLRADDFPSTIAD